MSPFPLQNKGEICMQSHSHALQRGRWKGKKTTISLWFPLEEFILYLFIKEAVTVCWREERKTGTCRLLLCCFLKGKKPHKLGVTKSIQDC